MPRSQQPLQPAPLASEFDQQRGDEIGLRRNQLVTPWLSMEDLSIGGYLRGRVKTPSGAIRWCRRMGVILRNGGSRRSGYLVHRAEVDRALVHVPNLRRRCA